MMRGAKMRQGLRALLAGLVLAVLTVGAPIAALADEAYTYTVRFYAGAQGTFGGSEVAEFSGLSYGDRVTFNAGSVTVNDADRYYVRGIRESGRDNSTVGATSFVVTEDADYVVAYGILGDQVAYTVNFVDEAGNALEASQTFYGNVGDKPVVACVYVPGYQPEYQNLTKTLSANAAENVFDFVYAPLPTEERVTTVTNTVTNVVAAPTAAAGAAAAAGGTGAAAVATVTPAGGDAAATETIADEGTPLAAPGGGDASSASGSSEEIGDLDTPLSSGEQAAARGGFGIPVAVAVGVGAAAALGGAALMRRRRDE